MLWLPSSYDPVLQMSNMSLYVNKKHCLTSLSGRSTDGFHSSLFTKNLVYLLSGSLDKKLETKIGKKEALELTFSIMLPIMLTLLF